MPSDPAVAECMLGLAALMPRSCDMGRTLAALSTPRRHDLRDDRPSPALAVPMSGRDPEDEHRAAMEPSVGPERKPTSANCADNAFETPPRHLSLRPPCM